MTFNEYQEETGRTAIYPGVELKGETLMWVYPAMLLASEQGEIASILQKAIRDTGGYLTGEKQILLAKEVGDCLWALAQLCESLDTSLDVCAEMNIQKLRSRMERGVIGGSGDNR